MPLKARTSCFVDGFNLYHSINELGKDYLKWVDLFGLAQRFVPDTYETLTEVFYFSAFATFLPAPYQRHKAYVNALETRGVTVILGKFKRKYPRCKICHQEYTAWEEKESDVNIGIHLIRGVCESRFDRALLITADTDLIPAIRLAKEINPRVSIRLIIPPGRLAQARDLIGVIGEGKVREMEEKHIRANLLPAKILLPGGQEIIRPSKYDPPASLT